MKLALLGGGGLLGGALKAACAAQGLSLDAARSGEVDARNIAAVRAWIDRVEPDVLIVTAARNAGVHVNIAAPADMLFENAQIALGAIEAARSAGVQRLLFCSSAAVYSESAALPYREEDVGIGPVEESHFGYSAAKLLGVRFCQSVRRQHGLDYTGLLLTNLFGPGQSYDPKRSNVAASLLARFAAAAARELQDVEVWGTGQATRDLIAIADAAQAILHLAARPGPADGVINIGSGREVSIAELAETTARVVGYRGRIAFDPTKPEGARRRALDISRLLATGWRPALTLEDGVRAAFAADQAALAAL